MTSIQQFYRWKHQVEPGGDRHEKLCQVTNYTLGKFQEAIAFKIAVKKSLKHLVGGNSSLRVNTILFPEKK